MADGTWATAALEQVPANALIGLRVSSLTTSGARVTLPDDPRTRNPYGAVQAGPLLGLLDAAALGAIIGHLRPGELPLVTAVAKTAELRFLAPARGELTALSSLADADADGIRGLAAGQTTRIELTTHAEARDAAGTPVTRATFSWVLRRQAPATLV